MDLGVKLHYFRDEMMEDMFRVAEKHEDGIRKDVIFRGIKW